MRPSPCELVHGSAEAPHRRRGSIDEIGHDLPQPLGTHGCRDVHRMHHVREQDRHLLVLRHLAGPCELAHRTRRRTWPSGWTARHRDRRTTPSRSVHRRYRRWGPRQYGFTACLRFPWYCCATSCKLRRRRHGCHEPTGVSSKIGMTRSVCFSYSPKPGARCWTMILLDAVAVVRRQFTGPRRGVSGVPLRARPRREGWRAG